MKSAIALLSMTACGRLGFEPAGDAVFDSGGPGTPRHLDSTLLGGVGDITFCRLDGDPAGNLYVVGHMLAPGDVGGGTLPQTAVSDIVVASYTSALEHRWSRSLGGVATSSCMQIEFGQDRVVAQGSFQGTLAIDGHMVTSAGGDDIVLVELDPAIGSVSWLRGFGGTGDEDFGRGLYLAPSGDIDLSMACLGTVDFGTGPIAGFGARDGCVLFADPDGVVQRVERYGGPGFDVTKAVARAPDGSRYVSGEFSTGADLGTGVMTAQSRDAYIIALDAAGAVRWVQTFGGPMDETVEGAAFGPDGEIYINGSLAGSDDLGGGTIGGFGGDDGFIARFDADGMHRWSYAFGGTGNESAEIIAIGNGVLYLAGTYREGAIIAGEARTAVGGLDAYFASMTLDGTWRWAFTAGSVGDDIAAGVTVGSDGVVTFAGAAAGPIDLGGGTLVPQGPNSGFLVRIDDP